jgi:hypothetical protein
MEVYSFLSGAVTACFLIACLFFLRFWRRTGDRLFLIFAVAFLLLGTNQALLALADIPIEERSWVYLLRLLAFVMIIAAIIDKSRKRT